MTHYEKHAVFETIGVIAIIITLIIIILTK